MQKNNDVSIALDDIHLMEGLDESDMYPYMTTLADDTLRSYLDAQNISFTVDPIQNIVAAGMGGSGQPVLAARSLFSQELRLPIILSQNYTVPSFVSSNTLFIAISHSGWTEEIIDQYCQAKDKGAQLMAIGTGGKLLDMAERDNVPCFRYESPYPPRASFAFMFGALLACLERIRAISGCQTAVQETRKVVNNALRRNAREVTEQNEAKEIALQLRTSTPLIYVEPPFDAIGARFTKTLNENAKRFAFYNCLPELRHNEIMCWTTEQKVQHYTPIFIRDDKQYSLMEQEVDLVKKMVEEKIGESAIKELRAEGKSKLARFYSLLVVVDLIAYYEAILMNKDPQTTTELNELKAELGLLPRSTACR